MAYHLKNKIQRVHQSYRRLLEGSSFAAACTQSRIARKEAFFVHFEAQWPRREEHAGHLWAHPRRKTHQQKQARLLCLQLVSTVHSATVCIGHQHSVRRSRLLLLAAPPKQQKSAAATNKTPVGKSGHKGKASTGKSYVQNDLWGVRETLSKLPLPDKTRP